MNSHNVRNLVLSLVIVASVPLAAETIGARWANAPLTIDGDGGEWRDLVFTYFDDDNSAIGIMNDAANLYLIVLSRDEATIRQMETRGLTVWIGPDGKKKKEYGLRYRGGMSRSRADKREDRGPMMRDEQREQMLEEQARLRKLIEVFADKTTTEIPVTGERGPKAAAAFGNDVYSYEFQIPFADKDSSWYSLRLASPSKLTLGVHVGYVSDADKAKLKDRFEGREGGPRGGGAGPGSGGGPPMGGGMKRGGGPPGERMGMQEKKEFWIEVQLAEPR